MSNCIFCQIITGMQAASIVHEDEHCLAFMDIHPMSPGHVLMVPRQHAQHVHDIDDELRAHLFNVGARIGRALRASSLKPDALHFMINDGRAAQQTVPHIHLHVLPRYRGDMRALLTEIVKKPLLPLLGPKRREVLDAHAGELRQLLLR